MNNNRGTLLFPVLFVTTLLFLMSFGVLQSIHSSQLTERGLASSSDVANGLAEIRMLTNDEATCAQSGLIDLLVDPLNPTPTQVKLYRPGTAVPLFEEGSSMGNTRRISMLRFVELVDEGQDQGGSIPNLERFRATLRVNTDIVGRALASSRSDEIQMVLALDTSSTPPIVKRCFGTNQCPSGQAVVSVTPEGALECAGVHAPCESLPGHIPPVSCVSDWIPINDPNGVNPFNHNLATVSNPDLGYAGNTNIPAYADYRVYVEWTQDPNPVPAPVNIQSLVAESPATFNGAAVTSAGYIVSGWLNKRGNSIAVGPIGQNVVSAGGGLGAPAPRNFAVPTRARVHLFPYWYECQNDGRRVLGSFACWYLGTAGQSCDAVCGANMTDSETTNFAGSNGTVENCSALSAVFAMGSAFPDNSLPGLGCTYEAGLGIRFETTATTSAASAPDQRRFCACLQ